MMGKKAKKPLQFFKYFDAAMYSNKLHIPSAYTLHVKGNLPDRASLRDRYGNMWPVELAKVGNEWYFQNGWGKVVQDTSIEHGDFLVFLFDGDRTFYYKIIGRKSCDKEGVGCLKFMTEEEKNGEEEGVEKVEVNNTNREVLKCKCCDGTGLRKSIIAENGACACHENKKKVSHDYFGFGLYRLQGNARPKNPYFVTKIRPKKPNELYIPCEIIESFKLKLPPKVILRDPLRRTWPSKFRTWKDGRAFCNGGWKSLCRANSIDKEDECVCEFLPVQGQGEQIVEIQIFRSQNSHVLKD